MMLTRTMKLATALIVGALAAPVAAHARPFSGSCQFSGSITPMPPITLVPGPGAHFSYVGHGTCTGGLPITVRFTSVATLFDTCELGPDFDLHGRMRIGRRRSRITISLARLAVAGPFVLSDAAGGEGLGVAQFATSSPLLCLSSGIATATLSASFQTISPLR